ncbi:hypothetical protein M407DRAFT_23076 [Tulasnella calospora MUT 4182]|uniref:Protein kinase domain-containing protein n=1 Tax=Tulasnella calospora MUT 4182 TaxID=1051891 RepID=A0A0C3QB45_9AGAM|nr:hypothetical protein M407DRAFT_23076 [Tulasnella calospora MUT 4182]
MSVTEATEQNSASAQAVDEEYEKLERFRVNGRRIVFVDDNNPPEGGFGIVRQAELHHSAYLPAWLGSRRHGAPQLVAVKQIKISKISNVPRVKRAFTREVLVWSALDAHPGIAKFLGFYADFKRSEAWLLSPWEPNGNVSEFIKLHSLEVPEKLSLVYDTIDALTFLHQLTPPVCHGDIKSANVLVTADYQARLCDFGLARLHEDSGFGRLETSTGSKGSIRWCSPELIDGAPRAPTSDVYAWAWLVWEIMTGDLPYEGTANDYAIIRKIFESPLPGVDGQFRLRDCLQVWELLMRCWNVDPGQRPRSMICKTTVTYLPRCTPTTAKAKQQAQSAALLENLGDLESWKGNPEKSSAHLDEALRLYQDEGNTRGIASVLRKQATVASRCADYGQAAATATAAREHFRNLNDPIGIADASFWLGNSLLMRDHMDEALPVLREALELYRTHGNDVGTAKSLERIGELQRKEERGDEALSTLEEAVAVTYRSGDRLGRGTALRTMGVVHLQRRDFDRAAEAFLKARSIAQNIGWYAGLGDTGWRMGYIKIQLGDYREAEALFQDSVSIARQFKTRWILAWALYHLGECYQKQSKLYDAASALGEACLLFQELSRPKDSVRVASTLVELKSGQGDWDGALPWHDHIIAVYRSQKEHLEVANHLERKAKILVEAKRYDAAALHFEASILTLGENGYCWRRKLSCLCAVPKTAMRWERRLPVLCDLKKLQQRQPQLFTAGLKLPIPVGREES